MFGTSKFEVSNPCLRLKPETKDGPPRLNFWNEVGKGKLEPKIVPMELEKDKWYRVVVKQIQNKSGQFHLRIG